MTALAICLENWKDGRVVANSLWLLGRRTRFRRSGRFVVGDNGDRQQNTNGSHRGDPLNRERAGPVKKCHPTGSSRWEVGVIEQGGAGSFAAIIATIESKQSLRPGQLIVTVQEIHATALRAGPRLPEVLNRARDRPATTGRRVLHRLGRVALKLAAAGRRRQRR